MYYTFICFSFRSYLTGTHTHTCLKIKLFLCSKHSISCAWSKAFFFSSELFAQTHPVASAIARGLFPTGAAWRDIEIWRSPPRCRMNSMSSGIDEIFMQLSIEERPRCCLESLCHVHSVRMSDFIHFILDEGKGKRRERRERESTRIWILQEATQHLVCLWCWVLVQHGQRQAAGRTWC